MVVSSNDGMSTTPTERPSSASSFAAAGADDRGPIAGAAREPRASAKFERVAVLMDRRRRRAQHAEVNETAIPLHDPADDREELPRAGAVDDLEMGDRREKIRVVVA